MRIVIDMQGAQTESRFRGIGRYSLSLAQAIVRNRGEHEVILALSGFFPDTIEPIRAAFYGLLPQENIRVWHAPGPVMGVHSDNDGRREVAELIREAFLVSLKPDVIHISSLFEGYVDDAVTSIGRLDKTTPVSVTLHDLIPLLNPDHYLKPNPRYAQYYRHKIEYIKQAAIFLAISESSKKEGVLHLDLPTSRVFNTAEATELNFQPTQIEENAAAELRQKFGLTRPFILYTGGADERKNLPRLIQAFAALDPPLRTSHQLLLAGKMPEGNIAEFKHQAKRVGLKPDELRFTGYVTDDELVQLYNLCQLFVFPSWHEGFGLPALEAMACGAPVIGANTTSLPEVIGLDESLFDPLSVAAIAAKMAQALGDDAFRASLREHGLQQAKRFSWDKSARHAITAFEKLHARKATEVDSGAEHLLPQLTRSIAVCVPPTIDEAELVGLAYSISRIRTEDTPRQLFVDISELVQRDARTGIQRVTRSILNELLERAPDGYVVEPVYATPEASGYRYARSFAARFRGVDSDLKDEPIDDHPGDIFLGLDLQHRIVATQQDYLTRLRQSGVRVIFVVYDLLPVLMPNAFPPGMDLVHKAWLETLTSFDGAICISKAVADELEEWRQLYGSKRLRPFMIHWFHLGADVESSVPTRGLPDNAPHLFNELAKRQTFLMVGTVEPRKGQTQTLLAFKQLWAANIDVNLVIVGKQGWMVDSFAKQVRAHPELNKRLFWLEGISDEYLEMIYAASTCLVAASEGEGFGLPLIEAAQHKLFIIARDIPVFREIGGQHLHYFDGLEPEALAAAIKGWIMSHKQGRTSSTNGMPWLTWAQSTQQLLKAIFSQERFADPVENQRFD
jgi:glycosyltransferase involved in cell wall biosynthesis